jgi:hypothetical protein
MPQHLDAAHRAAISRGSKGKVFSQAHRKAIGLKKLGVKLSEETKAKMSLARLEYWSHPEHVEKQREKISASWVSRRAKMAAKTKSDSVTLEAHSADQSESSVTIPLAQTNVADDLQSDGATDLPPNKDEINRYLREDIERFEKDMYDTLEKETKEHPCSNEDLDFKTRMTVLVNKAFDDGTLLRGGIILTMRLSDER